jgi:hypothetical protein
MLTEMYTLYEDLDENTKRILSESQPSDFTTDEQEQLVFHMEIDRHIRELVLLFKVFRFNMLSLRDTFHLTTADNLIKNETLSFEVNSLGKISPKDKFNGEIDESIEINALTINFMAAGRTVIDCITNAINGDFSDSFPPPEGLTEQWLSKVYDDNFHYRFLVTMRNYTQHGHLPVSVVDGKFGFDFHQILRTRHAKHNAARAKEMEDIVNEIICEDSTYPRFTFTHTIAECNLCVTEVYVDFLNKMKEVWRESNKRVKALATQHPNNVISSTDGNYHSLIFILEDESTHNIFLENNSVNEFNVFLNEAKKILREEKSKVNVLRRAVKFVVK